MTNSSPSVPPNEIKNTRFSVVIRVAFFIALVIVSRFVVTVPLLATFGAVVAASVGLYLTGILANLSTMRVFDRRPLADIGLQVNSASLRNVAVGILFASGAAALMLWAPILAGTGHLVARSDIQTNIPSLIFYLAALLFAAMGEELIFRGYAFQLLIEKMGPFATILPVSVLFGFAHGLNPNASRLAIANTTIWGVLLGYAFLRTHDLWLPIGLHFGWNAVLPLFGVNLSGHTIDVTRYTYRWDLMPIWSGGSYGPEGGLLTTIFVISLFLALMKAPVIQQPARVAPSLNDPF
jgi:membrane protease YdiL (CAAX protease family)